MMTHWQPVEYLDNFCYLTSTVVTNNDRERERETERVVLHDFSQREDYLTPVWSQLGNADVKPG